MRLPSVAAVTLLLAACAPSPPPAPSPTPDPTPPAPTAQPPTPSLSPDPTSVPEPRLPTAPAATTAGGLDADDLVVPAGWEPVVGEGSLDEGYLGNDSWVHDVDPVLRGSGTLSVGCAPAPDLAGMVPVAALEGTLGRDGAPGITLALEFADADAAGRYFAEYLRQLDACSGTSVHPVSVTEASFAGRRDLGTVWSEAAAVAGDVARFVIVDADLGDDDLAALAARLPR